MRLKLNSLKQTSLELELSDFHIDDIQWRDQTLLAGEQLRLNLSEIQDQIKDLTRNITVTAELAHPGESKRIVHVWTPCSPSRKFMTSCARFLVSTCRPGSWEPGRPTGQGMCNYRCSQPSEWNPGTSSNDLDVTKQLKGAGEVVGISLLDHIIFNRSSYFSLLENGLL